MILVKTKPTVSKDKQLHLVADEFIPSGTSVFSIEEGFDVPSVAMGVLERTTQNTIRAVRDIFPGELLCAVTVI